MADISDSIVFHGPLSELHRLADEGKIPTRLQGSHTRACKFWTAAKILSGVRNSVILTHGPSGCAYGVKQAYKLTNCRNSGAVYEPVVSTALDQSRIIYGGEKELKIAIAEVQAKYSPDVLFVATSCATGIIGDNVDAVVDSMRDKVRAKLMPIHCEGFAGEYRSGFDLVFRELVKLMEPPTPERKARMSKSVNIVGAKMGPERTEVNTDVKELIRLTMGMGAEINAVIAGNCTLDQLRRAPSVAVNCALCMDIGYAVGTAMRDVFGTPLNSTILPYGIAATEKWLRGAAARLQVDLATGGEARFEAGVVAGEFAARLEGRWRDAVRLQRRGRETLDRDAPGALRRVGRAGHLRPVEVAVVAAVFDDDKLSPKGVRLHALHDRQRLRRGAAHPGQVFKRHPEGLGQHRDRAVLEQRIAAPGGIVHHALEHRVAPYLNTGVLHAAVPRTSGF